MASSTSRWCVVEAPRRSAAATSVRASFTRANAGVSTNAQPDHQADADEQDAQQERDAPSPRQELIFGQARELGEHRGGEQQSGRHADLRPAAVEPAPSCAARAPPPSAPRRPIRRRRRMPCARRSTTSADRGPRSDLRVGRQQADAERGDAHDHERQDEHRLAADAVAEMADDDAADRPRDEPDGVGARTPQASRRADRRSGKYRRLKTSAAAVP